MTNVNIDSKALFEKAYQQDLISKQTFELLSKCNFNRINSALAIDEGLLIDPIEFFVIGMIIDDSGSIPAITDEKGNSIGADAICEGQRIVIDAFLGSASKSHEGVMVITWLLNSELPVQPITPLLDANLTQLANGINYNADGGTALYDQSIYMLGSLLAFRLFVKENKSAICKGSALIVSDGYDQHSTTFHINDVNSLVTDLEKMDILVGFIGIEGKQVVPVDFNKIAEDMGIPAARIFLAKADPDNKKAIRRAFNKASQASAASDKIAA